MYSDAAWPHLVKLRVGCCAQCWSRPWYRQERNAGAEMDDLQAIS